ATKTEVEEAIAAVKTALEGGDAEDINAKAQTLTQSAMKMGQQIYESQQAAGPDGEAEAASETAPDEDVVDAEFSEVDEDKKG
ncbi:MAG: molecular chaperone DnaK, partial [Erythrobacter sp.]|nr:molecular chaperone DnaK [Erythrobacter sp.]